MLWNYSKKELEEHNYELILGTWSDVIQDIQKKILTIFLSTGKTKLNKGLASSELNRIKSIVDLPKRQFGIEIKNVTSNDSQTISAKLVNKFQTMCQVKHKQLIVKGKDLFLELLGLTYP